MTTKRCPQCGNLKRDCVCARYEQDLKRFGPHNRRTGPRPSYRPLGVDATPPSNRDRTVTSKVRPTATFPTPSEDQSVLSLRLRVNGFNQLLEDVFCKKLRFGQLLVEQGISQAQVTRWRTDRTWLLGFLNRLDQLLFIDLARALPNHDARVLSHRYGLGNSNAGSVNGVALQLGIKAVEVKAAQKAAVEYLRGEGGRRVLKRAIISAAKS